MKLVGALGDPATPDAASPTGPPAVEDNQAAASVTVTSVVDGDTVDVSTGETIRVIGIDTAERGDCGYAEATRNLEALVLGKPVELTAAPAKDDKDKYGRLLRYLDVDGIDAGLDQITKGFAVARYDSRDGYGEHPRETEYVAADATVADFSCTGDQGPATSAASPSPPPSPPSGACHPSYTGSCLPIVEDLNCPAVPGPVTVVGPDAYHLDRDRDGVGCE